MSFFFVFLYIVLFIVALRSDRIAVVVFIAHLPIKALIHTNGTIPLNDFFSLIMLYHLLKCKTFPEQERVNMKLRKLLIRFLTLSAVVIYATNLKYIYIRDGIIESIPSHLLHGIILSISIIDIALIVRKYLWCSVYQNCIDRGFMISSAFLSLSVFFSAQLYGLGLDFSNEEAALSERTAGLFADGDCNGLAGFLCLSCAIILFYRCLKNARITLRVWGILILNTCAIFYTQSRMGFLCIVALLFYYYFILSKGKTQLSNAIYLIFIALIVFFFTDLSSGVFARISEHSLSSEFSDDQGRSAIWGMYLDYMLSAPKNILLLGTDRMPFNIVPHNFYIYTLFVDGLLVSILFVVMQLIVSFKSAKFLGYKYIMPINILTIIPMFFLTSGTIIYYYVLAINLLSVLATKKRNYKYQSNFTNR